MQPRGSKHSVATLIIQRFTIIVSASLSADRFDRFELGKRNSKGTLKEL